MKLEMEKKHSGARAKILLVLLSVLCKLYVRVVHVSISLSQAISINHGILTLCRYLIVKLTPSYTSGHTL